MKVGYLSELVERNIGRKLNEAEIQALEYAAECDAQEETINILELEMDKLTDDYVDVLELSSNLANENESLLDTIEVLENQIRQLRCENAFADPNIFGHGKLA